MKKKEKFSKSWYRNGFNDENLDSLLTLANLLDESFGHWLLVADLAIIEWALRQDDLDAGGSANSRRLLVATNFAAVG